MARKNLNPAPESEPALSYLTACPSCGDPDLDTYHRDYEDERTMVVYLRCPSCRVECVKYWGLLRADVGQKATRAGDDV